jgi:hypothetical protein
MRAAQQHGFKKRGNRKLPGGAAKLSKRKFSEHGKDVVSPDGLFKSVLNWFEQLNDEAEASPKSPSPTMSPTSAASGLPPSQVSWIGNDLPDARTMAALRSGTLDARRQLLPRNLAPKSKYNREHFRGTLTAKKAAADKEAERLHADVDQAWYIINPNNAWKLRWDMLVGLFIVFSVVTIPFSLSFDVEARGPLLHINTIVDCSFGFDLLFCFFTGYTQDDGREIVRVIYDHGLITRRYLRTWFVVDFASTFPFDHFFAWVLGGDEAPQDELRTLKVIRIVRLFRLLKLVRLFKVSKALTSLEVAFRVPPSVMKLLKLMLKVAFVIHFFACFWYWMGSPCPKDKDGRPICGSGDVDPLSETWAHYYDVYAFPLDQKYLASFYWVTTTMMGVGYGELCPQSLLEKCYAVLVQIVGATVFGFIIANITSLLENINPRIADQRKKMQVVREWMYYRELTKSSKIRIRSHYDYMAAKKMMQSDADMLAMVPTRLKMTVALHMHKSKLDLFRMLQSQRPQFIASVVFAMRPCVARPREVLLEITEIVYDVYFLARGLVHGLADGDTTICAIYESGDHFADVEAWADAHAMMTYEACTVCDLFIVEKAQLMGFAADTGAMEALTEDTRQHKIALEAVLNAPASEERVPKATREAQTQFVRLDTDVASQSINDIGQSVNKKVERRVKAFVLWRGDVACGPPRVMAVEDVKKNNMRVLRGKVSDDMDDVDNDELSDAELIQIHRIIPPAHPKKVYWDMFVGALIIYSVLIIPLRIGFDVDVPPLSFGDIFDILVDVMFVTDMIMSFRTAFRDGETDMLVIDPVQIRRNYLQTWFTIDFFSTAPIDRIVEAMMAGEEGGGKNIRSLKLIRTFRLIRLLKLMRLLKMAKLFQVIEREADIDPIFWRLFTLLAQMLVCAHTLGCFWFLIHVQVMAESIGVAPHEREDPCALGYLYCLDYGVNDLVTPYVDEHPCIYDKDGCTASQLSLDAPPVKTWWTSITYGEAGRSKYYDSLGAQYVASLYWACTTMTTVGYGDITPTNMPERIYAICAMFFGATMFGYVIGSIASIYEKASSMNGQVRKRVAGFRDFLDEQRALPALTTSILKDYEFRISTMSASEDQIMSELPPLLRQTILVTIRKELMTSVAVFHRGVQQMERCSPPCVAAILADLKPRYYVEGDHLISMGDTPRGIFSVSAGLVEEIEIKGMVSGSRRFDKCLDVFPVGCIVAPEMLLLPNDVFPHLTRFARAAMPTSVFLLDFETLDKGEMHKSVHAHLVDAVCDAIVRQRRNTSKVTYLEDRNLYLRTLVLREEKIGFQSQPWALRVPGDQVGVLPGQRPVGRPGWRPTLKDRSEPSSPVQKDDTHVADTTGLRTSAWEGRSPTSSRKGSADHDAEVQPEPPRPLPPEDFPMPNVPMPPELPTGRGTGTVEETMVEEFISESRRNSKGQ